MTRENKIAAVLYALAALLGAVSGAVVFGAALLHGAELPTAVLAFGGVNGVVQLGVFVAQAWIWRLSA